MKKILMVFFLIVGFAFVLSAGDYIGYMTSGSDGKNRSVVIINTVTGDFEVYDIDNKAFDRKENEIYYDCIRYNRTTNTREIIKIKIPEGK
ncbi:MAG: hypothetical protein N3E50_02420 [Candidatus Goldbacteria bacterium]|nr:hypothetical protein [Candidatus Goldiibacteriota bacterium]